MHLEDGKDLPIYGLSSSARVAALRLKHVAKALGIFDRFANSVARRLYDKKVTQDEVRIVTAFLMNTRLRDVETHQLFGINDLVIRLRTRLYEVQPVLGEIS